jgi:hypothetical protein
MKTMCAEDARGLFEVHGCNNCKQPVVVNSVDDLYMKSGLCEECRDDVYKEMYEGSLEGQLEKICKQLDEILGQTKEINKTLRGN